MPPMRMFSIATLRNWIDVAMLATVIAGVCVAYSQLSLLVTQVEQAGDSLKWQNYNETNRRYAELFIRLGEGGLDGRLSTSRKLSWTSAEMVWAKQYFNLCSEEYWLHVNGLLPRGMWAERIRPGIARNLVAYPKLINIYREHVAAHAADEMPKDSDFISEMESIISSLNRVTRIGVPK